MSNEKGFKKAFVACSVFAAAMLLTYSLVTPAFAKDGEHHPHIHAALKELRDARSELKEADHDFGGHRAEALKAVDEAITQLEVAAKFDKK